MVEYNASWWETTMHLGGGLQCNLVLDLKRASYCWKSLEKRGSKPLFPKIRLCDHLQLYHLLVETQTITMALNMIVYFIYFSGCVSTVVTGIVHEYNCDLLVAHVETTL